MTLYVMNHCGQMDDLCSFVQLKSWALSLKIECDVCFLVFCGSLHENGGVLRRQKETGKNIMNNNYK